MSMKDINKPVERRRMIEYGADGCKVVRHYHSVQQISGSLFKSENKLGEFDRTMYDIFVVFPDVRDGLKIHNQVLDQGDTPGLVTGRTQLEQYEELAATDEFSSKDGMIRALDAQMEQNRFIGNAQIEFVRQWNPERAECYAAYRQAFYERRAEEKCQRELAAQEEEAAKERERQEQIIVAKAAYCGWADDMTPLRFGKVVALMEQLIRFNGKLMTRLQFIKDRLQEGWKPIRREGVTSWYGSRWDRKESKPRTEYRLQRNDSYFCITKTEFDFASYLAEREESLS